jgi:hypothetical protein
MAVYQINLWFHEVAFLYPQFMWNDCGNGVSNP